MREYIWGSSGAKLGIYSLAAGNRFGSYIYTSVPCSSMMKDSANINIFVNRTLTPEEQLLEAVAFSAKELLSNRNWQNSINEILMRLGRATASSRVYVFRHEPGEPAGRYTSLAYEWCAPGVAPQISAPELQHIEVEAVGFQRWIDLMSEGKTVFGSVDDFPENEQPLLEQQQIKSLIVIPFFVTGKWWGFIGFDQCDHKRNWSAAERGALQAAASMIGSAIERQNAEERLQTQFQELQKTNYELDSFVYRVSHDLRAPLATILGLVNIAEKDKDANSWPMYLQYIRNSITRLDTFTRDILEYSRNTRIDVEYELVDVRVLLAEVREYVQLSAEDVRFQERVEGAEVVLLDRKRMLVILNNLITNACKFRDTKKTENQIIVTFRITDNELALTVEDNGIGIDSTHIPRIFDMFYRATDRKTGSGLGLYIAKETVAKLGGSINVESVFGEFTKVEVRIPLHRN